MTTDLEKQFFEVFNIPKIYRTAINIGDLDYNCVEITATTLEQLYEDAQIDFDIPSEFEEFKNNTDLWEHEYPEITDRILLELICILNNYGKNDTWAVSVENLKDCILMNCIKVIKERDLKEMALNSFKHRVQALFKEER